MNKPIRLPVNQCSTIHKEILIPVEAYLELHPTHLVWAGQNLGRERDYDFSEDIGSENIWVEKERNWLKKISRTAIASIGRERSDDDDTWDVCIYHGALCEVITVETQAEVEEIFTALDAWWTASLVSLPYS